MPFNFSFFTYRLEKNKAKFQGELRHGLQCDKCKSLEMQVCLLSYISYCAGNSEESENPSD